MRTGVLSILVGLATVSPLHSEDALDHWSLRDTNVLTRVRFVGGVFVGVGAQGKLMTSEDGTTWVSRASGTGVDLNGVAAGTVLNGPLPQNLFTVVGNQGTVLNSTNGTNWTSALTTFGDLHDVAYGASKFVATTTRGAINQPNLIVSTDGFNWSGVFFFNGMGYFCSAIACAGGLFITAGGTEFAFDIWRCNYDLAPPQIAQWQKVGFSDQVVCGIIYGNGRFVIVGYEGLPCESTDGGSTWSFYGGSDFGAVVPGGYPMTGNDIAFGNGTFVLARGFLPRPQLTSFDGKSWIRRPALNSLQFDSVTFGKGTFVAVGGSGIYQSDSVTPPHITANAPASPNSMSVQISGEVGRGYRLQTSTDLLNWSDRWCYTNTGPMTNFTEAVDLKQPRVFYRVVSP